MHERYLSTYLCKRKSHTRRKAMGSLKLFFTKKQFVCKDTSRLLHAQNFTGKINFKFYLFVGNVYSELFWMKMDTAIYAVKSFTIINLFLKCKIK